MYPPLGAAQEPVHPAQMQQGYPPTQQQGYPGAPPSYNISPNVVHQHPVITQQPSEFEAF